VAPLAVTRPHESVSREARPSLRLALALAARRAAPALRARRPHPSLVAGASPASCCAAAAAAAHYRWRRCLFATVPHISRARPAAESRSRAARAARTRAPWPRSRRLAPGQPCPEVEEGPGCMNHRPAFPRPKRQVAHQDAVSLHPFQPSRASPWLLANSPFISFMAGAQSGGRHCRQRFAKPRPPWVDSIDR